MLPIPFRNPLNLIAFFKFNPITFPSTDSFLRLLGSYLLEYQADWVSARAYISSDNLLSFWDDLLERRVA